MENNGRTCIYLSEIDEGNTVTVIIYPDAYKGYGVRVAKEGSDPYGEIPALEINYENENGERHWISANDMSFLFYSDMADFVKRNIGKAITPEECEALESGDDDDDENDEED